MISPDLVYGDSYLIHYMTQCVLAGKIPLGLNNPKDHFTYCPVHSNDVALSIEQAFSHISDLKGGKYTLSGSTSLTLHEIVKTLEEASGKGNTATKSPLLNIGLSDFVEEFWVGFAHDKNMVRMAKFFELNPELKSKLRENDLFAKTNTSNTISW